ncbi:MAG TPA: hypothetical protein VMU86_08975, partial [Steroidobacteraceae bacterium]|nr:hypothetical protein [Steroidobacteraceae bacterium]
GIPLILPRHLFDAAAGLHGDAGLRELAQRLEPAQRRLLPLRSAAADVDASEDLRDARRRWRGLAQMRPKQSANTSSAAATSAREICR